MSRFDSSENPEANRGPLSTRIGVKNVIQGTCTNSVSPIKIDRNALFGSTTHYALTTILSAGWDEGVLEMSLGEQSILTIPG